MPRTHCFPHRDGSRPRRTSRPRPGRFVTCSGCDCVWRIECDTHDGDFDVPGTFCCFCDIDLSAMHDSAYAALPIVSVQNEQTEGGQPISVYLNQTD